MGKIKLYAKGTALAGALLVFAGCGESNQVIDSFDTTTSVSDTTDEPAVTSLYENTSVLESDGTTAYYVTDEIGETSFIDASDFVSSVDGTTKTRETTSVGSINDTTTSKSTIGDTTSKVSGTTTSTTSKVGTTTRTTIQAPRVTTARTTSATKNTTTTSKVTTTTTTTTTTTPKVTTTTDQSNLYNYTFDDITHNIWAFRNYSSDFQGELIYKKDSFGYMFNLSYGITNGGYERNLIFAALNDGYISNNVLNEVFSSYSHEELENSKEFFYKFGYIQQITGNRIDFTKYTINKDLGIYLNKIQNAYFSGSFDEFMTDQLINGQIPQEYLNNVAVMTLISSYDDCYKYVTQYEVEIGCMAKFMDKIYNSAYGYSYTK